MLVRDVVKIIESVAPLGLQESWDNSGLIIGDPGATVTGTLLCLDVTEDIFDEASESGCNMIISHHPLVFAGLKKFTGTDPVSRMIRRGISEDYVIYSAHTNLDQVLEGVSGAIADKLGFKGKEILVPRQDDLLKLVCFIPDDHFARVVEAVFSAGAGYVGNYDSCGFNVAGTGSFRAGKGADPYIGEKGELHFESEKRFETIFPKHIQRDVVSALLSNHPYEEVAYDIYPLRNENKAFGLGVVGELPTPLSEEEFLRIVKRVFTTGCIRHTAFLNKVVKRVAVLGGSGSEYLKHAVSSGADAYITADIKYHQFFNVDNEILLLDIGHYESEHVALEVLSNILLKKKTNFAVHLSKINTNPIKYF